MITKNQWRELRIYNSYDLARVAGSKLFIDYVPSESGRAAHRAYWRVVGMGFKTDKDAAWFHFGKKSFDISCREQKPIKLLEAIQWCKDKYKITGFEKDSFGHYQIEGTVKMVFNKLNKKNNIRYNSITKTFKQRSV